jgi:hypothetical protein
MTYKMRLGAIELSKILEICNFDYELAERKFNVFSNKYNEEEIEKICDSLRISNDLLEEVFE